MSEKQDTTTINIVKDNREKTGWVTFTIRGQIMGGQAKVYNEGDGEIDHRDYMGYGVKVGSRVSKLWISSRKANSLSVRIYEYDRGLDYHDTKALPQELLDAIINDLDNLPRLT